MDFGLEGKREWIMQNNNNNNFLHNIHCEIEDGLDFILSHFQEPIFQGKL